MHVGNQLGISWNLRGIGLEFWGIQCSRRHGSPFGPNMETPLKILVLNVARRAVRRNSVGTVSTGAEIGARGGESSVRPLKSINVCPCEFVVGVKHIDVAEKFNLFSILGFFF